MNLYQNIVESIPPRFHYFIFFSLMAWVSLFKPQHGEEMVDDAFEGNALKARNKSLEAWKRGFHD